MKSPGDAMTDISSEKRLWQAVVLKAMSDATHPDGPGGSTEQGRATRDAISWLRSGGRDFRTVCHLAGVDPDFIQGAYLSGGVDPQAFHRSAAE